MNVVPTVMYGSVIGAAADIVAEAAAGRMFILVDDEDRENEGDLVIAAQFATAEVINFMARFGRGLICLALTPARVRELNLPAMPRSNGSRFDTAFTASIEARCGVTTGISAADRARTIAVAVNPESQPSDLTTPGHVFPICAREGGTLIRAGHTEAAVDVARIAGLNPAGVICEIMNEDGTMARLPELSTFARKHGIKIGTIADLITYRNCTEKLIEQVAASGIHHPAFGEWRLMIYRDTVEGGEHIALVKGNIEKDNTPALVKLHFLDPIDDLIFSKANELLAFAMYEITKAGRGTIVLVADARKSAISSRVTTRSPHSRSDPRMRDYGISAQILVDLGAEQIVLITEGEETLVSLEGYGLNIVGYHPCRGKRKDPIYESP